VCSKRPSSLARERAPGFAVDGKRGDLGERVLLGWAIDARLRTDRPTSGRIGRLRMGRPASRLTGPPRHGEARLRIDRPASGP